MKRRLWISLSFFLALVVPSFCQQVDVQPFKSELDLGVQEYKKSNYHEALVHFQKATELDPTSIKARLYLGTTYATLYAPGDENPDNKELARKAVEQFQKSIELNPGDPEAVLSLKKIASLYFNMRDWERSKEFYQKAIKADPNDLETHYSIGVIDWTLVYKRRMERITPLGVAPWALIEDPEVCTELRNANLAIVEDGLKEMHTALQLRSDYDDAMAYLNLLYRERAAIQCGDEAAYNRDTDEANAWVDRTIATKKAHVEKMKAMNESEAPRE